MIPTLKARDILSLNYDTIWNIEQNAIKLELDDGVIETTGKETIYSWYLWKFHQLYPKTPLLIKHHIGKRRLGNNTHLEILSDALFDCFDFHQGQLEIEFLCKIAYETINTLFNDMTYKLEAYVSSINILDFIDVVEEPEIKLAKETVQPNQASIDEAYLKINTVLKDKNKLIGNPISKAAKSGLVSIDQIDQCIGFRGFISDIDSHIFKKPILRSYVEGIVSLHDAMIESRSASKALMYTKDPLKQVEYFNRRMQMICATLREVVPGDCGSQRYLRFKVRSGDLESVAGKNYLDDDGKLKRIHKNDRHLIGKELNLRSVFFCNMSDRHRRCSTCFGDLYLSVPKFTNQGHASAIILGEKISQNVMSTKHLDGSSKVDAIELNEFEQNYIQHDVDPNKLKLADRLRNKRVRIRANAKEAKGLSDLNYTKNVESLEPYRVTQLVEVMIIVEDDDGIEEAIVPVSIGNRLSSFTQEMLYYIKEHGWNIVKDGFYEIDLVHWHKEIPIFSLPMKHLNMADHTRSVDAFISSPMRASKKKNSGEDDSIDGIFYQLYKLISTKIRFNIAHLEIIMFSTMITSYENRDFDIPFDAEQGNFGYYASTMKYRSLSVSMAYQGHVANLLDPNSYIIKKRPSHPFDYLLMG